MAIRAVVFDLGDVPANVDAARWYGWAALLHTDTASTVAARDELLGRSPALTTRGVSPAFPLARLPLRSPTRHPGADTPTIPGRY